MTVNEDEDDQLEDLDDQLEDLDDQLEDLDKLNDELQGCVWRDRTWSSVLAVTEVVRNVELVLRALCHELNALCPSCDNLVEAEHCRLTTLVRTVEDHSVKERALIVALNLACC